MEHNLFKPKSFEESKHAVVGDCNGVPTQQRWKEETPLFAQAISSYLKQGDVSVLDYGCGSGRLAKEVLKVNPEVSIIGIDDSTDQLRLAREYINDNRFIPMFPEQLDQKVDLAYCVYVLQHIPAIAIREVLQRIYTYLKDDGTFVYCSSDYRMAIRFDGGGFFDDRFLGVNLQEEIGRYFDRVGDLFAPDSPQIIKKMVFGIDGGLQHPAVVFRKRRLIGRLFNALGQAKGYLNGINTKVTVTPDGALQGQLEAKNSGPAKLILTNRLSPGDVLVMSVAIRALHTAHPGKFLTDIDTPCNYIYDHNPYITKLNGDGQVIDMHYPEIHKSGASGRHFTDGHRKFLEEKLGVTIPRIGLLPDIHLTQDEKLWPSPVLGESDHNGPYWVINAGAKKNDYPLKQYHRWQEVADLLIAQGIKLVQIGQAEHAHPPLNGVIDMRGKTAGRLIFRTIYHAEGVLTCVSYPMHIAAAFEKPCVVVAGGREPTRWELYPNHRFLYMNGALPCAKYNGCWKNKIEECERPIETDKGKQALCLEMTRPEDIARAVDLYYIGGALKKEVALV